MLKVTVYGHPTVSAASAAELRQLVERISGREVVWVMAEAVVDGPSHETILIEVESIHPIAVEKKVELGHALKNVASRVYASPAQATTGASVLVRLRSFDCTEAEFTTAKTVRVPV